MDLPTEVITKICEKLFTRSETGQIDYYPFFEPRHSVFQLVNMSSQALRCCSQFQAIGTPILYGSNTFAIRPTNCDAPDTGRLLGPSKAGSIQHLVAKESRAYEWRRTLAQYPDLRSLEIVLDLRYGETLPWPCKLSQEERDKVEWKHAFFRDSRRLWGRTPNPSDIIRAGSSLAKRGVEVVVSGCEVESAQRKEIWSWSTYTYHPRRVSCQSRAHIGSY